MARIFDSARRLAVRKIAIGTASTTIRHAIWLALLTLATANLVVAFLAHAPDVAGDYLTIISTIAASIFAAVGAATTPTTQNSRLTFWGWIAIAGVAISTIFALTIRRLEIRDAREQEELHRARYERTLALNRSTLRTAQRLATPLQFGYIAVCLSFPSDLDVFAAWMTRLRTFTRPYHPDVMGPAFPGGPFGAKGVYYWIGEGHSAYPNHRNGREASAAEFLTTPMAATFSFHSNDDGFAEAWVGTNIENCRTRILISDIGLRVGERGGVIQLIECRAATTKINSSDVSSFLDLPGTRMFMELIPEATHLSAVTPPPELLSVDFGRSDTARTWQIPGSNFQRADDDWSWSHTVSRTEFAP
jgi:hypothetical protein